MKTETRKEEHVIVNERTVYIADDGKEFNSEEECILHETGYEKDYLESKFEAMKIKEFDGIAPLNVDSDWPERDFWWFNLKNKDDYDLIVNYYKTTRLEVDWMREPSTYPALVCMMESYDYVDTMYFDSIIKKTKLFFEHLGYTINIVKEENYGTMEQNM